MTSSGTDLPDGSETPLVSVIIPTYNSSAFLRQAIESVLAQTYKAIEVVVVNDGSTDDTEQVMLAYGNRITPITQQNAGTSAARNTGILASKGSHIAFLDHDDRWLPEKLAKQMAVFAGEPELGMVHCGREFFNDSTGVVTSVHPADPGMDFHDLLALNAIALQSAVIPRSVLKEVGLFDVSISGADDWEMCLRIACKYPISGVPDVLVEIRGHEGQQSTQAEYMYRKILSVFTRYEHVHGDCKLCRLAAAEGRKQLREGFYQRMLASAKVSFRDHRHRAGTAALLLAIRENPAALMRVPKRMLERLFRPARRSHSSG